MAAPNATPKCHTLRTLPTELLLKITKPITNLPSLNGLSTLLAADHRGDSVIENHQTDSFANVLGAGKEEELSRVVTAVMTLRNDSTVKRILSMKGAKENFIRSYLRSDDRARDGKPLHLQLFSDPIATIRDIASVSEGIEALVQDFAHTRIIKPSEQPDRPPSSAELYRTRRAFWYFQLCYELVHAEESIPSRADADALSQRSRRYVYYQTHQVGEPTCPDSGWLCGHTGKSTSPTVHCLMHSIPPEAVQEIEAARFHLASLVNAFQYQGQAEASCSSWQPALLQRLIKDLDHWREDKENPVDHLLVADLGLEHDRSPDREQWGWAMWDAERLSKRGLSPDSQDKRSRILSDRAFRECEDVQSTYIDRWVTKKFRNDVRLIEEENRQREEEAKRRERKRREEQDLWFRRPPVAERKTDPEKPLSGRRARRKAKAPAQESEAIMKGGPGQRKRKYAAICLCRQLEFEE